MLKGLYHWVKRAGSILNCHKLTIVQQEHIIDQLIQANPSATINDFVNHINKYHSVRPTTDIQPSKRTDDAQIWSISLNEFISCPQEDTIQRSSSKDDEPAGGIVHTLSFVQPERMVRCG